MAIGANERALFLDKVGRPLSKRAITSLGAKFLRRANLGKKGSAHIFRHSAATAMLEGGADVRYMQAMLGHASLLSTQVYTHVAIGKLQAVHAATHPGAPLERKKEKRAKKGDVGDRGTEKARTSAAHRAFEEPTIHHRSSVGRATFLAKHRLAELDLFTDEALAELLDNHPRNRLIALTMGSDLTKPHENRMAVVDRVSGAELLRAVKQGRLWVNVVGIEKTHPRYRALVESLYHETTAQCPGFVAEEPRGTLLISSPNALVYYHVDGPPSLLWHIRGTKRVWVYPPLQEALVAREMLEDIFAGVRQEYVPYRPSFDAQSEVLDLEPGDVVGWAQNAPHRVTNGDIFNVSLSTEHTTEASRRRMRVYCANRLLRHQLGYRQPTIREHGLRAAVKASLYRACKAAGLDPGRNKAHIPEMSIDSTAPLGCVPLHSSVPSTGALS